MKQNGARAGGQDTEIFLGKSPVKKRSGQWTKNFEIEFETKLQLAELVLNEKNKNSKQHWNNLKRNTIYWKKKVSFSANRTK